MANGPLIDCENCTVVSREYMVLVITWLRTQKGVRIQPQYFFLMQISYIHYDQARSQKSAMGGCFGGLGVWWQSPQPPEARGPGGGAPSAQKFCIFLQK